MTNKATAETELTVTPIDADAIPNDFWILALSYIGENSRIAFRTTSRTNRGRVDQYRWYNLAKLSKTEQWRFLSWHCARYQEILTWSAEDQQMVIASLLAYIKHQPPALIYKAVALTTLALLGAPDKDGELNRQLNFAFACLSWIDPKMANTLRSVLCAEKNYYDRDANQMNVMLDWIANSKENDNHCEWQRDNEPQHQIAPFLTSLLTLRPGTTKRLALNLISSTCHPFTDFFSLGGGFLSVAKWRLEVILRNVSQIPTTLSVQLIAYYLQLLGTRGGWVRKDNRSLFLKIIFALMKQIADANIQALSTYLKPVFDKNKSIALITQLLLQQRAGEKIAWREHRQSLLDLSSEELQAEFIENFTVIVPFLSVQAITDLYDLMSNESYVKAAPDNRITWQLLKAIAPSITSLQAQQLFIQLQQALACNDAQHAFPTFASIIPHLGQSMLQEILSAYDTCNNSLRTIYLEINDSNEKAIFFKIYCKAIHKLLFKIATIITIDTLHELTKRLVLARSDGLWLDLSISECTRQSVLIRTSELSEEERKKKDDDLHCVYVNINQFVSALANDEIRRHFYDNYISESFPLIVPIAPVPSMPEREHHLDNEWIHCAFLRYLQSEKSEKLMASMNRILGSPLPPDEPLTDRYHTENEFSTQVLSVLKILASSPLYCLQLKTQIFSRFLRSVLQLTIDNPDINRHRRPQRAHLNIRHIDDYLFQVMRHVTWEQADEAISIIRERFVAPFPNPLTEIKLNKNECILFLCVIILRTRYDHVIELDELFTWMKFFLETNKDWDNYDSPILKRALSMLLPLLSDEQCRDYYKNCLTRWHKLRSELGADGKAYKPSEKTNKGRAEYLTRLQVEFMACLSHRFSLSSFDSTKSFDDNYFAKPLVINGCDLLKELKNGSDENNPEQRCSSSLRTIKAYCDSLTQLSELQEFRRRLFTNAYQDPELAYLFARRGFFSTSTLNRHQFFNTKGDTIDCSETAVEILEIIQTRYNELLEENATLTNELTESDDEFLEQTGSGWTNSFNSGYE